MQKDRLYIIFSVSPQKMKGRFFMKEYFGTLPSGEITNLYTISCGKMSAAVSDYGATLVRLFVPDRDGVPGDVVLGCDDCLGYLAGKSCLGATVGRNANRLKDAAFVLDGKTYRLGDNENGNNLHSGPDYFFKRLWTVVSHTGSAITTPYATGIPCST